MAIRAGGAYGTVFFCIGTAGVLRVAESIKESVVRGDQRSNLVENRTQKSHGVCHRFDNEGHRMALMGVTEKI